MMDVLTIANISTIIAQSAISLQGKDVPGAWEVVNICFNALYVRRPNHITHMAHVHHMIVTQPVHRYAVEVVSKITLMGWVRYWRSNANRLDFLLTVAGIAADIIEASGAAVRYLPNIYPCLMPDIRCVGQPGLVRLLLLLRILRLLDLLANVRQFAVIFRTFAKLAPQVSSFINTH
jgi:hypothetical protein